MPIDVAQLQVKVTADTKGAQSALTGVEQTGQKAAGKTGAAFVSAGRQTVTALRPMGGAVVNVMGQAGQSAAVLADQMTNVATVVPDADIGALTDQVQELSRASGVTTTDLTQGLYDLVSAGVSADDAIHVLTKSTDLAIGGLGTTAGAADVVTTAMNAFGLKASDAGHITDVMAAAIAKGKVTTDEIGASIANVGPVAAAAGVSLEEVGSMYANLTASGVPASEATTQMKAAISSLLTPNEQLNRIQAQTGINFAELAREKGLSVALDTLRGATEKSGGAFGEFSNKMASWQSSAEKGKAGADELEETVKGMRDELGLTNTEAEKFLTDVKTEGMGEALANLQRELGATESGFAGALGSVEALQFSLLATGDNAGSFQAATEEMTGSLDGFATAQADIKKSSPVEEGKRMTAMFETFMQDVGGPLTGVFGGLVTGMANIGPAFRGLGTAAAGAGGLLTKGIGKLFSTGISEGADDAVKAAGPGVASKLGGLFSKAAGGASKGIAAMGSKLVGPLVGGLGAVFTTVLPMLAGAVSGLVAGIGGLVAAAIPLLVAALPFIIAGAVIAAILAIIFIPGVRDAVFGFIGGILDFIGDALAPLFDFLAGIFGPAFEAIGSVIGGVLDTIGGAISGFFDFIGGVIGTALGIIGTIFSTAFTIYVEIWSTVFEVIWNVVSTIFGFILEAIGGAVDLIGGIFEVASGVWSGIWDGIAGAIGGAVDIVVAAIEGISGVVGTVTEIVGGFFDFITGGSSDAKTDLNNVGSATPQGQFDPSNPGGTAQHGAWSTTEGLWYLHAGEMVLPPTVAEGFRNFIGRGGGGAQAGGGGEGAAVYNIEQNITVPVAGLLRAERPQAIAETMRRVADLGFLDPEPTGGFDRR